MEGRGSEWSNGVEMREKISWLQRAMVEVARSASAVGAGRRRRGKKQRWWSEELEEKKKIVCRLRRKFQMEGDEEGRRRAREEYRKELREYKKFVRRGKQESWHRLLSGESERLWGLGYKLESGKFKGTRLWHSLRTGEGMVSEMGST